jgi:hypothetical protein
MRRIVSTIFRSSPLLLVVTAHSIAQWSDNPAVNIPIASASGTESYIASAGDKEGNVYIVWSGFFNSNLDIFAQKIDSQGRIKWTPNGVSVSSQPGTEAYACIVPDYSGGAIIAWYFSSHIYAQRIGDNGTKLWGTNGITVCNASGSQRKPQILYDNNGGAIVTWDDNRSGNYDVYAQRLDMSGAIQWAVNGVPVIVAANDQTTPLIVTDGGTGAIIVWSSAPGTSYDIVAQKLDNSGAQMWGSSGKSVTSYTLANEMSPSIASDGYGGLFAVWQDDQNGTDNWDIFAQRLDASGTQQWGIMGSYVAYATGNQLTPYVIADGLGGMIATWRDYRTGDANVYAQKLNGFGLAQWTSNEVTIASGSGNQDNPRLVSDGFGGAFMVWSDDLSGHIGVYAQRVDNSGKIQWTSNGIPVATHFGNELQVISQFPEGGYVCAYSSTWYSNYNIFAQNVSLSGRLGLKPKLVEVADVLNDQGGYVNVLWDRAYLDGSPSHEVTGYYIWRGVLFPYSASPSGVVSPGESRQIGEWAPPPASLKVPMPSSENSLQGYYWELVGSTLARSMEGYSIIVPTPNDSGPQSSPRYYFVVSAQTTDQQVTWYSNVDSAYSVDNLSPAAIQNLTGMQLTQSSVQLKWAANRRDSDLGGYVVYRSPSTGFVPDESHRISALTDTTYLDSSLPSAPIVYYRVRARDIHGNLGGASPQVAVALATTQSYAVTASWNMISVPMRVDNFAKEALYPTATSETYAYSGGYMVRNVLENGVGYWLKFPSNQSVSITGFPVVNDTISVASGWNMIGSIGVDMPVTQVTSNPPGLVVSPFYTYETGYVEAESIQPHKAYWVKAQQAGALVLAGDGASGEPVQFLVPSDGPPNPPFLTAISNEEIPATFTLEQNFPNPFNPTTEIRYGLPQHAIVQLAVFNTLGQQVAVLAQGEKQAGFHTIRFDAVGLSSGVYLYRLQANEFVLTRKLLLLH